MASCVEQSAHTTIPSHFHTVNQFQVLIEGSGTLGKRPVQPWSVHYTNGYTGYGPLCAGAEGMVFVTLRNRFDAGAIYFPAGQSFMQPAPKRHHLAGPLLFNNGAVWHSQTQPVCEAVLEPEDDGLAAWCLRLGPGMHLPAPDAAHGGGQYLLVASGSLWHNGIALPPLSCLYLSADAEPFILQSGTEGLAALLLQFPVAEASAVGAGRRSRRDTQASRDAEPGSSGPLRPAASRSKPALANPEHVALVRQGASAITAWRAAHPGERLYLAQADLAGANLCGAQLQGARLFEANLDGADLAGANLQQADMRAASLRQADLTGAHLQHASLVRANLTGARLCRAQLVQGHLHGAYLQGADLQETNLQRAYLISTNLVGADLRGADLTRADLQWANLQEANLGNTRLQAANLHESVLGATLFTHTQLHGAQGLDTCRHQSPSYLDAASLTGSTALPAAFLRGCSGSEALLDSLARQSGETQLNSLQKIDAGCAP